MWRRVLRYLRPAIYSTLAIIVLVLTSSIVSSYNREIQTFAQEKISKISETNETVGEFLTTINEFVFNGARFDQEARIDDIIFDAYDSVVLISTQSSVMPNSGGIGSGFFIEVNDEYALIMTNHHVISDKLSNPNLVDLKVITAVDLWEYDAEIIGYDEVIDIAIIRINKRDNEPWEALEFADPDEIREGDPVVVIGHGMRLAWTSTFGHVSFNGRFAAPYNVMLQIDAVVNQGNSGGPVIGLDGKVYGIIGSILSPGRMVPGWDGVAFAVHPRQAQRSIDYILSDAYDGYVPYADLAFPMNEFTYDDLKDVPRDERSPVYVDYTNTGDPEREDWAGMTAGLVQGDVLVEMDGLKIVSMYQVILKIVYAMPGDTIEFLIQRGEQQLTVPVVLQETNHEQLLRMLSRTRGQ